MSAGEARGAGGEAAGARDGGTRCRRRPRAVDVLVAEIGSTTTVVSAFDGLSAERLAAGATPRLLGQGVAATSVLEGDVTVGVNAARAQIEASTGPLEPREFLATSSAAGGLRMTVHGLTAKMTAMAAREAALGAGGVVEYQTAGKLRRHDLERIAAARPNVVMLAGGVEGGDVETVLHNAEMLVRVDFAAGGGRRAAAAARMPRGRRRRRPRPRGADPGPRPRRRQEADGHLRRQLGGLRRGLPDPPRRRLRRARHRRTSTRASTSSTWSRRGP